jgi:hypothetical protein
VVDYDAMFPYEVMYAWVIGYGLIGTVLTLIACLHRFDWDVVNKRQHVFRNLMLKNEGGVALIHLNGVGVALWERSQAMWSQRYSKGHQIARFLVKLTLMYPEYKSIIPYTA